MYKVSDFQKNVYRVNEAAKYIGVSTKTIREYCDTERLIAHRTDGNQRVIFREDLINYLRKCGLIEEDSVLLRHDVIYARVSSHDQKDHGDLDRQALFLTENVHDMINPIILKEVGSGLNDKRTQLKKLMKMVCNNEVRNVYVTCKDRLTRFGFNYLKTMFEVHGTTIVVVKDEANKKSVEEELVEDMMSLMASFSGKLYGLRSRKNKVNKHEKSNDVE